MKPVVLTLALLLVASPLATAAAPALAPPPAEGEAGCGGVVCQVLCWVLTRLGRPCPRGPA